MPSHPTQAQHLTHTVSQVLQVLVDDDGKTLVDGDDETGVKMYGVQHQLAKMQTKFERIHDNYNIVQRYRVEAERQNEIL